jgi:hypothetical protein
MPGREDPEVRGQFLAWQLKGQRLQVIATAGAVVGWLVGSRPSWWPEKGRPDRNAWDRLSSDLVHGLLLAREPVARHLRHLSSVKPLREKEAAALVLLEALELARVGARPATCETGHPFFHLGARGKLPRWCPLHRPLEYRALDRERKRRERLSARGQGRGEK